MSRFSPQDREVRVGCARGAVRAAPDGERPDVVVAKLAGHPPAAEDRHHLAASDPDLAAEEEHRSAAGRAEAARGSGRWRARPGAEAEDPLSFQKELALFGKEEAEAGEVDLLGVRLHLGEIGVPGEVGGEPAGDPDLGVHPVVASVLAFQPAGARAHPGAVADDVGLDLDGPGTRRRFEAHEGARRADLGHRPRPHGGGKLGQIGILVLPAHDAAEVDPPDLGTAARVAQGLEGDRHLHGPAVFEPGRPRVPDRGPVAVHVPLIHDEAVEEAADRVQVEEEGVPPVVEGVQDEAEVLVVVDAEVIAPHFGGEHPVRLGVPAAAGDVEGVIVVEDPDLRPLGSGLAFERQ